uniref:Uncharacterized protein n=1 Tax=Lutzomyia longipalpis TaxID=7200 RepID=A0A1B0CVY6_LUTLO
MQRVTITVIKAYVGGAAGSKEMRGGGWKTQCTEWTKQEKKRLDGCWIETFIFLLSRATIVFECDRLEFLLWLLTTCKVTLPPRFSHQHHIPDNNIVRHSFAHVVDCECSHCDSREGFHLHSSLPVAAHKRLHNHLICLRIELRGDIHETQWNVVAERDDLRCALRCENCSNLRHRQHVPLRISLLRMR